jgi:hypothetical protein
VERCRPDAPRQIREEKMRKVRITFLLAFTFVALLGIRQGSCFAQHDGDDIVIGTYRTMHSRVLDEDRLLFVHLPREYNDTQLRYPVLYLLYVDLSDYFTDAITVTEKLGGTGEMPPVIIIGVANTNRYRDLLPAKSRFNAESGGAGNFLRFIEEELIPYIDNNYRTVDFHILVGPQAAAVFSLYALIEKPELFDAVISENPFMNPENAEFLYPRAEQFLKTTKPMKHLLYIRCEKNERPQNLAYAERFSRLLDSENPQGLRFKVEFSEPSGYFTPPPPLKEGLRTLFAGHQLPPDFQSNSLQDILHYYERRSEEYGFKVVPPDHMLTSEGVKLNQKGKAAEAVEVFEYQRTLYPRSLNALLQLGETYRGMGEFEKARDFYRKFLEIRDRDAAMIHRRIEQIGRMIDSSAAYRIEQEIRKSGIKSAVNMFWKVKSDSSNRLYFAENEFNAMGYRLMGAGNMEAALEIFKLNVELYPKSANVYDSLGEAYLKLGDNENASTNYRKSLELNPENNNAKEALRRLEKK